MLTRLITNWANDAQGAVKSVALVAPVLKSPGDAKSFPQDSAGFAANVHPLLTLYCARCHATGATGESALKMAPPFRFLSQRYPIENLAEAFAEGIVTGHPDMPEFQFLPDEIDSILGYLKSLQKPRVK